MSVSNLFSDNTYDLQSQSLATKRLDIDATLGTSDVVVSNPGLHFGNKGSPYITSGDTLRFGSNSASAGFVMNFNEDGSSCDVAVKGEVVASNSIAHKGHITWSGGGSTEFASVPGMTSSDLVYITTTNPASQAVEFSHVVATTDGFTVHLTGANTSDDWEGNWMVIKGGTI